MGCPRRMFSEGVILNGRYQSLQYVHAGSFGMVFTAKDLETDEIVAIKVLTKKSAVSDEDAEFAIDNCEELEMHQHLGHHPNIVNLITSFETEAHLYLVMEYCERGDLYEAIHNGQSPAKHEDIRRMVIELIDAVEWCHMRGIYHRDIKPENIFLTRDGHVKLGDFGLSTTEEVSYETAVGSDRYMAPEQCETDGDGYSPAKADIWAIGICLLNIVFGRNPFKQPTEEDSFFRDFSRDANSLFDIFTDMSDDTFEILKHCLNLNPQKRSLSAARHAVLCSTSFKESLDIVDDFLSSSPRPQTTLANREPLATPVTQSPMLDNGDLWTKALHCTPPQLIRPSKLASVQDAGSFPDEDLFAKSTESETWSSANTINSHSLASTAASSVAFSRTVNFKLALPEKHKDKFEPSAASTVGSLPITMSKAKPVTLSDIFGRKDKTARSWSDMVEEDEELDDELTDKFNSLKINNARTFSHESTQDTITVKIEGHRDDSLQASATVMNESIIQDTTDRDDAIDGLFMYEPPSPKRDGPIPPPSTNPHRYNTPMKRTPVKVDWNAIGERRRAYVGGQDKALAQVQQQTNIKPRKMPNNTHTTSAYLSSPMGSQELRNRRNYGLGQGTLLFGPGSNEFFSTTSLHSSNHINNRNRDQRSAQPREALPWRRNDLGTLHRDGRGDCRDWNWRRERRIGNEWVGNCLEARS